MKTMEEMYQEVMASAELQAEFAEAAKTEESAAAWLKKNDCNASLEEVTAFLRDKTEGEMSDDEVEAVAGGNKGDSNGIGLPFGIFWTGPLF